MTQQTAAKLNESASSVTMSCFLLTADSAWKSRKKKAITLANTGDPEISQPLGILPS
jgi:hypothetical protein